MWRELLADLDATMVLGDGALEADLVEAEEILGYALPAELRAQLAEVDGVRDAHGYAYGWPLKQVVDENLFHRAPGWPFGADGPWRPRVCFGADGAGDDFFLELDGDGRVFRWSYIDRAAEEFAPSLEAFWAAWSGRSTEA